MRRRKKAVRCEAEEWNETAPWASYRCAAAQTVAPYCDVHQYLRSRV